MEKNQAIIDQYTNALTLIFSREDRTFSESAPAESSTDKSTPGESSTTLIQVKGIRLHKPDGTYRIRLHVEKNGQLEPPFEFALDESRIKITKIKNYSVPFDPMDVSEILYGVNDFVKSSVSKAPLEVSDRIGWQIDSAGAVTSWKCATAFDLQGKDLVKDIFQSYPTSAGSLTDNISFLKNYIAARQEKPVAQAILLYGFSAILAGYLNKCLLVSLSGKSSRGKTTLAKLVISLYGYPEDTNLSKTFNITLNRMAESLNGLYGAAVLIDDLSLMPASVKRDIGNMIYVLESGKEKERMRTKSFDRDPAQWATTIIFSAEEAILSLCSQEQEGAVGRLMELHISADDLFNDAEEANQIASLSHQHYGLLAEAFVKRLMSTGTLEQLHTLYEAESKSVRENYTGPMARMAENVAVVTLCGRLLNQFFQFGFDVDGVKTYLMATAQDNLENFRMSQQENVVMNAIYPQLINYARTACKEENEKFTDRVVISSKAAKAILANIQKELGYKPIQVKQALADGGVIIANDGKFSYTATIKGKSFRGICLAIKDEQVEKENE